MAEDNNIIGFSITQNYPKGRKFTVLKPLKKSFKDSVQELLLGKQG